MNDRNMSWEIRKKLKEIAGEEEGICIKDPGGRINVCLVYPNTYYLGMSNLGFTSIYSFLNSRDDVFCERAFSADAYQPGAEKAVPLFTVETQRRVGAFDLVGFSVSFENDYLNIVRALAAEKIPSLRTERGEGYPLVFCGGFAPHLNPEVLAEICDFLVLGDGEPPLTGLLEILGKKPDSKRKFLEAAASIPGVYVPSLYEPLYSNEGSFQGFGDDARGVQPAVADINRHPAFTTLFTRRTEFGDMFLVEIARGCVKKCFFCGVSHSPHGFRCLDKETIKGLILNGLRYRKRVGLVGSAVLDHPDFLEIARFVLDEGAAVSPASIRADMVSEEVADVLGASGLKTAALAPETGDEARRLRVGKGIRDEQFFEASLLLFSRGIANLKLYFIAGLPGTREDDDVHHTVSFVKKLNHHIRASRKKSSAPMIIVSMGGFVPKGMTPFQFAPFPGVERLRSTYRKLRKMLGPERGVKFESDVPKYSYLQALLSTGDRRISRALSAWDGKTDPLVHFKRAPVNPDYFAMREKTPCETLPWDGIFRRYGKEKLWERYRLFVSP